MGEFDRLSTPKDGANIAYCYNKMINKRRPLVAPVWSLGYPTQCPLKKAQP